MESSGCHFFMEYGLINRGSTSSLKYSNERIQPVPFSLAVYYPVCVDLFRNNIDYCERNQICATTQHALNPLMIC